MSYIISSGITSDGIILEYDSMTVQNGGTALNTTVNTGGRMNVSSGGSANTAVVNISGRLYVSNGGAAFAILENGGYVSAADSANVTFTPNVLAGLSLTGVSATVHSGTTANTATVDSGGGLFLFSGGKANNTTVNGNGRLHVSFGAVADDTAVNSNGSMTVSGGGTATRTTLAPDGTLIVGNGGTADTVTVSSGAAIVVSSGGTATGIAAEAGAFLGLIVASDTLIRGTSGGKQFSVQNASVSDYTVADGYLNVSGGATAARVTVDAGARLTVYYGGTATEVRENGGNVSAMEGARISYAVNTFTGVRLANGSATVHNGTTANSATVDSRGGLILFSGGKATGATVNDGGSMFVSGNGIASGITVNSGGSLFIYSGGIVANLSAGAGAYLGFVAAAGTYIQGMTDGGTIDMKNGVVSHYTVRQGSLSVSSGGIANSITVDRGGRFYVSGGGAAAAILENGGYVYAADDANVTFAANTISGLVLENDSATVHSGTTANAAMLGQGGYLNVYRGGTANDATVSSGGYLRLFSGGTANGTVIGGQGHLHITEGGAAHGTVVNGGDGYYQQGDLYLSSGGTASGVTVNSAGVVNIIRGGAAVGVTVNGGGTVNVSRGAAGSAIVENGGYVSVADDTDVSFVANTFSGLTITGSATVHSGTKAGDTVLVSGAKLFVYRGGTVTGRTTLGSGAVISASSGTIDFDLTRMSAGAAALVNDLSLVRGTPVYTLTVDADYSGRSFRCTIAEVASKFNGAITVVNTIGDELGTLTVGGEAVAVGETSYSLDLGGGSLTVTVDAAYSAPAKGDRDGNGVSDVMFVWTGNNYSHGYWMNGTSDWWSANSTGVSSDWNNLGSYDMSGDGKADAVMFGNVEVNGAKGAYIGYYQDGDDANGWVNIGFLDNSANTNWKNAVGNLTGGAANSIVWYAPELYALGVWTDGTDSWVTLGDTFGSSEWTLVGCGDFDGDGADSVLMAYNGGQIFYTADLDGTSASLGSLNWSGWDVRAIGDFAGDGKDDMVLFHQATGSMVMLADGKADNYVSIGQLDPADWFVAGCGDYNGDGTDDLLVRQYSTGMLGYYSGGDTSQWNTMGFGVDMSWTVIA